VLGCKIVANMRLKCKMTSYINRGASRGWHTQLACGMESRQSLVWNRHKVAYGINPKVDTRWRVMPYRRIATDSMHPAGDSMPILRIG